MDYYIYLNVPEYTRQFALHHFPDEKDNNAINVKNWYVLYGFVVDNLKRYSYIANFSKQELGNLKVIVPDSRLKRKQNYNYLERTARIRLSKMIREIMFSQFWQFILPLWPVILMDKRRKYKKQTLDECINIFFEENHIDYSEEASNSFKKEFQRQRKKLAEKFNITI